MADGQGRNQNKMKVAGGVCSARPFVFAIVGFGEKGQLMPSLFRRLFTLQDVDERAEAADQSGAKASAVAEAPASDPTSLETVMTEIRRSAPNEDGMIPADQLPSAAKALAELFPAESASDPFSTDGAMDLEAEASTDEGESSELGGIPEQEKVAPAAVPIEATAADSETAVLWAEQAHFTEHSSEADAAVPFAAAPAEAAANTDARDGATIELHQTVQGTGQASEASPPENGKADGAASSSAGDDESSAAGASVDLAGATHTTLPTPAEENDPPTSTPRDWKLEEKLASHIEWLESHGRNGLRADLSDADLEGQELIGVQLKWADLHDANLRAADLLLADLRDATLIRADLEDSCLVGANLEAANLEGATLETAMGLVPRQIAGANLRDALLPPQIMEFEAAAKFERASRIAWRCFAPLVAAVLISWLVIWKVNDAQLLTNSAVIPYFHSRTAAVALPTAQIFLLAPLVLFSLYLVFHFHLQKVWDAVLELPAIFPDGHALDDSGPEIIVGLLRAHFWWINREGSSTLRVEKAISVMLAYWVVPLTLALFWARYLTMQDARGTLLQTLLVAIAAGVALHATSKSGRPQERWASDTKWTQRLAERAADFSPVVAACALGTALLLLSIGTIAGVPHDHGRAPQYSEASIRRWAPDVFWAIGYDPYADLTEATMSIKPPNWTGAAAQLASVKGLQLNEARFRYAQAYGIFLVNAHLWHADFEGAYLSDADLRGADLGHSDLRRAILDGALLSGANLNRARLDGAMMARADVRGANLSYASLANAFVVDSRMDGATLYDALLTSASLARADLEKADLRGSYLNAADLNHADLQQAYLWSAKLPGANLYGAKLQGAVAIGADLRGADLREAQFAGTVLNDAKMSGADLDRADLRGALGLTAFQVCSSRSRRGALLDDALAMQVTTECGGLQ
jgi:uncharacterized protein YjbI with pentapeptide repeats